MRLADEPDRRAHFLRRAMLNPERYLAAALAELPDEELGAVIRAHPRRTWRLRLCRYPRVEHWAEDIAWMARLIDADAARLDALLGRLGVQP
jgi:hypothetical protein